MTEIERKNNNHLVFFYNIVNLIRGQVCFETVTVLVLEFLLNISIS